MAPTSLPNSSLNRQPTAVADQSWPTAHNRFQLESTYQPTGDQPAAIDQLIAGVNQNAAHQVLLGVTGSGKTFTMANVIQAVQKPTLVIAHNKTLAAQLYQEFRDFFPHNAVSYFVSYYDYYQPEAYLPSTDTYIEKEAQINDEIDKLRLAATTNLLTRPDVIIVASVSCIYNLGSPIEYGQYILEMIEGELLSRQSLLLQLTNLQYERSDTDFRRGTFRLRGDTIQLWPAYQDTALNILTLTDRITNIQEIDPLSGQVITDAKNQQAVTDHRGRYLVFPAKHYLVDPKTQASSLTAIEQDLSQRVADLKTAGHELEAYRLNKKVRYDLNMIREFGFVNGIENYSRYFDGRQPGQPPYTLLTYFQENLRRFGGNSFLTMIDESHITLPQIKGMHHGDQARKATLIEYGFRLPSSLDNRPLNLTEFLTQTPQNIYVSATPSDWEINQANGRVVEQLVRPTGLLDPEIELRHAQHQIPDLIIEILNQVSRHQRVLVTTLTKKMAEDLTDYLNDQTKINNLIRQYLAKPNSDLTSNQPTELVNQAVQPQSDQKNEPEQISSDLPSISPNPAQQVEETTSTNTNLQDPTTWPVGEIPPQLLTKAQLDPELTDLPAIKLPKVAYLHSDVETLERSDILADLRQGKFDVLVGINLLREGLDLPEVSLVAILDADQAGFLRSTTSLIQTMGRAARHEAGRVILYGYKLSLAMQQAISETYRRRQIQLKFNQDFQITPHSISKPIRPRLLKKTGSTKKMASKLVISIGKDSQLDLAAINPHALTPLDRRQLVTKLTKRMNQAAKDWDFELAALIRDKISQISQEENSTDQH